MTEYNDYAECCGTCRYHKKDTSDDWICTCPYSEYMKRCGKAQKTENNQGLAERASCGWRRSGRSGMEHCEKKCTSRDKNRHKAYKKHP